MLKILNEFKGNILAVSGEGKITGADYEMILIPEVEKRLKINKKIRLLYCLGESFQGFELSAMLDDLKIALEYFSAWEKIALVSDHALINDLTKIFGVVSRCEVLIFKSKDLEKAKMWIGEDLVR
jgi:hypothetical protein